MIFNNMKVANRLALVFGLVLIMSIVSSVFGLSKLASIQASLEDVVLDNNVKIQLNHEMAEEVHVVSRIMRTIALLEEKADKERENQKLVHTREAYNKAWDGLNKYPASETGKANRAKIAAAASMTRELNDKVIAYGMGGQQKEAVELLMKEAAPAGAKWQAALADNIRFQEENNAQQYKQSEADYHQARLMMMTISLVSILAAAVLGWLVTRSITGQLGAEPGDAAALAQSVANGDLSVRISLKSGDSHSMMAQLKVMQDSLVKVVDSVREGSESVATASAQIAQGNNDLSARTEQQASALEETAASMEELSSTVKQNADSARQANQLAVSASDVAIKGGEVVSQVVETMKSINDSSKKIADIISVIDGIAFQTNILALNAAVEAARAGEQGRGFAVVASEVRSLAGRSADAAKEIKSLIGASVERVELGTTLVDQAGETMTEVVNAIKRVTDLMGEISAASNEQSAGVSQVGEAVMQMDQVTQQNAALVEEMAAAASSLKSQAHELVQTVAVFKLSSHAADYAPARVAHRTTPAPSAHLGGTAKPNAKLGTPVKRPTLPKSAPLLTSAHKQVNKAPSAGAESGDWESF
mgnify:CR=1 FL=1